MSAQSHEHTFRIFVAAPVDVATERAQVHPVVASLSSLAAHLGVALEVLDWHRMLPDAERPPQVIFERLQPTAWDIFLGIVWQRFGTSQDEDVCGTEAEFQAAYCLWQQFNRPRLLMYRCTRGINLDTLDLDQFKRVKGFFDQLTVPHRTFDTPQAFEELLFEDVQRLLLTYNEAGHRHPVAPQTVAALVSYRHPTTLPARAAFFGRNQEMKDVLRALSSADRSWGVVIDGIGGIGKTALALEAAYRCQEQHSFDGFVFISAKQRRLEASGIESTSPDAVTVDEFINETARAMGQPDILQLKGDAKRAALLDTLRPTRTLLIYDNLETLSKEGQEAIADFLRFLPQSCKAIVTSRRRGGEGAVWLRLEKLDWLTARQIIEHESKKDGSLARTLQRAGAVRWQELYDETGGSPLALIWTLGLMRARALTFDRALEMLRYGASHESDLQQFIYAEARKELSSSEATALNALSFFAPSAAFEPLMVVADLSRTALERVLERLSAIALVDVLVGEERYALHPLTRHFIRCDLLTDQGIAHALGTRFALYWIDYIKRYGVDGNESDKTYDRLKAEWGNLHAAANWLSENATMHEEVVADKETARMTVALPAEISQFLSIGYWDEKRPLWASITASTTSVPAVPGKSTAALAEKDVAELSQTLNNPDRSVSRYDFFIAYATPDRRQAQDLSWFLQDDSCEVFLDVEDLRPGVLWLPALREALEASRAIVVLVSTHADDAFYQQEEIVRAIQLARNKPRAHTVIPVILEKLPQGAASMPYGLSRSQAQDATRSGGLKRVAAELVAWLKDHH